MAKSTHWASEESREILPQHSESIWCSLLHYLLPIDGMMGDLESLLTGSQMNGYLVLAEVFLCGQLVWDSFESRFSFGSRDLPCVIFYTWKCLKHWPPSATQLGFVFCPIWSSVLSLIPWAPLSVFPLHHYHLGLDALPISQRCWGIRPSLPESSRHRLDTLSYFLVVLPLSDPSLREALQ